MSEATPQRALDLWAEGEELKRVHEKLSRFPPRSRALCKPYYDTRECPVHPHLKDGGYDLCQFVHCNRMSQQHHEG